MRAAVLVPLMVLLAGCAEATAPAMQGYVEGIYVRIAAERGGRLVERPVRSGDTVAAGDLLFALDDADGRSARRVPGYAAAAVGGLAAAAGVIALATRGRRNTRLAV